MVLKHFALKDLFAYLNIEKYEFCLSKRVIEETKELIFVWVLFITGLEIKSENFKNIY